MGVWGSCLTCFTQHSSLNTSTSLFFKFEPKKPLQKRIFKSENVEYNDVFLRSRIAFQLNQHKIFDIYSWKNYDYSSSVTSHLLYSRMSRSRKNETTQVSSTLGYKKFYLRTKLLCYWLPMVTDIKCLEYFIWRVNSKQQQDDGRTTSVAFGNISYPQLKKSSKHCTTFETTINLTCFSWQLRILC